MNTKIKSTRRAKRINIFAIINPDVADIDIGNPEIVVAVSPPVSSFLFKEQLIKTVAMETREYIGYTRVAY